ncbi:unnamed protein product [Thelazia callipaeda]|uniref:Exonuclease domain-containing protein n=1 Tax=Thelazia callipaeda TaxID=103827 RepID=A0A0N5CXP7_THECL|nr:unnamed protein product [Thelazia callipaeda]
MSTSVECKHRCMQSFVFLDIETNGLFPVVAMNPLDDPPVLGGGRDLFRMLRNYIMMTSSHEAPYVTEISLLSVTRKAILSGIAKMDSLVIDDEANDREAPHPSSNNFRIPCNIYAAQKFLVFVYSQEDLEDKNDFVTEWKGVKLFLEHAPKPVCIVAHNGIKFDFRVLYAEFERNLLLSSNPIPDQVYFVDSYLMFLDLEKKLHDELRTAVRLGDWNRLSSTVESEIGCDSTEDIPAKRQLFAGTTDDHPLNNIRTAKWSPAKKKRIRPDLFKRSSKGNWLFNNHFSIAYFREKGAFKLESIYKQAKCTPSLTSVLNDEYDAHHAVDDCEALLKICIAYGREFIEYVEMNAAKFPF